MTIGTHQRTINRGLTIEQRFWTTQSPPFVNPLPFTFVKSSLLSWYNTFPGDHEPPFFGPAGRQNGDDSRNKAYEKFTGSLREVSGHANNLLEARESISTVEKRASQLVKALRSLRKLDFPGTAKALGLQPSQWNKNRVKASKSLGDNWLEYHFGWEPAVQDIGASVNFLQKSDFGLHPITGRSRSDSFVSSPLPDGHFDTRSVLSTRFGAKVKISNPNAALANQMGFVNPLSVAWEAVPYSFVVDWFGNVGQCLSAMTDFVGFEISSPYTTVFQVITESRLGSRIGNVAQTVWCVRDASISGPTLALKPFKGFSVSRGATAISLLLQHL